jgi:hypothetical protein
VANDQPPLKHVPHGNYRRADWFEARCQRLERLLKLVQSDPGNWLHLDLSAAIEQEVGKEGPWRSIEDSGIEGTPT